MQTDKWEPPCPSPPYLSPPCPSPPPVLARETEPPVESTEPPVKSDAEPRDTSIESTPPPPENLTQEPPQEVTPVLPPGEPVPCNCAEKFETEMADMKDSMEKEHDEDKEQALKDQLERVGIIYSYLVSHKTFKMKELRSILEFRKVQW